MNQDELKDYLIRNEWRIYSGSAWGNLGWYAARASGCNVVDVLNDEPPRLIIVPYDFNDGLGVRCELSITGQPALKGPCLRVTSFAWSLDSTNGMRDAIAMVENAWDSQGALP